MTYYLTLGRQKETNFLSSTMAIAQDVTQGNALKASKQVHADLFHGGPLAAKSFNHLLSLSGPSSTIAIQPMLIAKPVTQNDAGHGTQSLIYGKTEGRYYGDGSHYNLVKIEKKVSFSAFLGILEGIPVIGSAIGAIDFLGRLPLMLASYVRLKRASVAYINGNVDAKLENAKKVFAASIDFATHQYYLGGSALSIIPGLKPLTRLVQGIIFNGKAPSKLMQQQEVIPEKPVNPTRINIKQHRETATKYDKSQLPAPAAPPRREKYARLLQDADRLNDDAAMLQKKRIRARTFYTSSQLQEKVKSFKQQTKTT
jgi:hypothetical protein